MKFALFYADTQQFIAARDDREGAVFQAKELAKTSGRKIIVFHNGPEGDVDHCCTFDGNMVEVVSGQCLGPVRRWLLKAFRVMTPC